ncbi:MAG TPA: PQQ-dependent sugar dehydrogenase [Verrucomicrobiae bacterium]|nr:PQQ-dependent sugar dehydrogenase [Verrucomicrobiae bacterium]
MKQQFAIVFAGVALWLAPLMATAQQTPVITSAQQALIDFTMGTNGDVERGRELFKDGRKTICARCHTTDGSSGKAGPDLFAIGDKFSKHELIRAVLEPSAEIAIGYDTTIIEDNSGESTQSVIKEVTGDWIELMGGDGKRVRIATKDIKSQRTSPLSLMPQGLEAGLTREEFANLIAYLGNLQQPPGGLARHGMPEQILPATKGVTIEPFFRDNIHLTHPTWFGELPGETNTYIVLEHSGKSWIIEKGLSDDTQTNFVDLSSVVRVGGGCGFLGMAFHPKFLENRKYYLQYQIQENDQVVTILAERKFSADFEGDSGEPSRILLKIPGSTQDHHGGCIAFGPDGYLYFGMGDTGPQRDPQGHGQNLSALTGKMLRIDVDHQQGDLPYAIPASNPFIGHTNARPEIWAYGFREPWRYSFDSLTHDLWVGDVGQDRIEEVDIVRGGENYGWNVYEGFDRFSDQYRRSGEQYIAPVFAYPHHTGVSITGGYVYRGHRAPAMQGWYICADFEVRHIWALTQTNRILEKIVEIGRAPTRVSSISQDASGELYLVGYDAGKIYHLGLESVDTTPLKSRIIAATSEAGSVEWRYILTAPTNSWFQSGFDDGTWTTAPGGFGTRGTPGAVVRTDWHTDDIWLRRSFDFPAGIAPDKSKKYVLRLNHDEDVEVYLNGVEAARLPQWTAGYVEVPLTAQAVAALNSAHNVLAVHCHQNTGGQYIDVGLIELATAPDERDGNENVKSNGTRD